MQSKRESKGSSSEGVTHPKEELRCDACGRTFTDKEEFDRHRKIEDGASPAPEDIQE